MERGERFAAVGSSDVNGGWAPHLHFQVAADLLGMGVDFPGGGEPVAARAVDRRSAPIRT
ncbi:MAG: hypothetical protein AB2L07_02820 [Thermoanaerobaculaceae bacterium]